MTVTLAPGSVSVMTNTYPARTLHRLTTPDLIAQYDLAISTHAGRYTNTSPRQKRINKIVDLLSARADDGDAVALAFYES